MTASNYPNVLPVTLKEEGGKVNNPKDPGGRTNQGITQRVYDAYRKSKGFSIRTVYSMEPAERDEIYEKEYWRPSGAYLLPNGLDLSHFDGTVNSGKGNSSKWLVKARTGSTVIDQIQRYADARLAFLHVLRTWATFGRGWSARVGRVEAAAIRMAAGSPAAAKAALTAAGTVQKTKAVAKRKTAVVGSPVTLASATAASANASSAATPWIIGITVGAVLIGCLVAAILASQHEARSSALMAEAAK